jgi:hypothetical protein
MLEELRKLNQPGRKEDILFFLQKVIGKQKLIEKDIRIICARAPGQYQLDVDALLLYCAFLRLIHRNETIVLSPDIVNFFEDSYELNKLIIKRTISALFESDILEVDMFAYDVLSKRFAFKNERLPLSFAPLRNTLISQGFFEINRDNLKTVFYIDTKYEKLISSFCQQRKKTIGIEQLKKQLEANSEAGEKAEIFVLQYEKKRIGKHPLVEKIRIISDIDVCAGYDIVSFNSNDSDDYDRFIEVKAVSNPKGFYWSINELNTAKLKGKRYYLYLIDLQKVSDENYIPTIINDPASVLFDSDEWFVEPQSFHIWHV